jgi:hypothetical protein
MSKTLNVNLKSGGGKCKTLKIRTNQWREFVSSLMKTLSTFMIKPS